MSRTTYYRPRDHSPEEWRRMAADCRRRSAESFARSDTDGFLSQWAADTTARLYDALAASAENDGIETFTALWDVDRDRLLTDDEARQVQTRYGYSWAINVDGEPTVWFRESTARNPHTRQDRDTQKGYLLVTVERPSIWRMGGNGYSLHPVAEPVRGSEPIEPPDFQSHYTRSD